MATSVEEETRIEVNILPTSAQTMPAVTPPMNAARASTRMFGMNMYMSTNTAETIT